MRRSVRSGYCELPLAYVLSHFGLTDTPISWLDEDSLVLNPEIPKSLFLPPGDFEDVYLLGPKVWEGFNAGGFFIRVNDWSIKMLTETMAVPLFRLDIDLRYNAAANAMKWVFTKPEYRDHILYQSRKWYNDFQSKEQPEPGSGSLLVHLDGTLDENSEAIEPLLDAVEKSPYAWQIPVHETPFPEEVERYWTNLRVARQELGHFIPNATETENGWDAGGTDMIDLANARVKWWWAVREEAQDTKTIESLLGENEELRKKKKKKKKKKKIKI